MGIELNVGTAIVPKRADMGITSTENTRVIDNIFNFDYSKYHDSNMRAYTITYKLAFA